MAIIFQAAERGKGRTGYKLLAVCSRPRLFDYQYLTSGRGSPVQGFKRSVAEEYLC